MKTEKMDLISIYGLSQAEAQYRLQAEGPNELPETEKRQLPGIALDVLREPMFFLLMSAGSIYLILGDMQDAFMLLGFVCIVIGISIYQEYKTERVLEALRELTSPRALVIRDSVAQRIAGREVVRGDMIILAEGDRVPADAILTECSNFKTDESLLTGESLAVLKVTGQLDESQDDAQLIHSLPAPGGDNHPYVYSGTLVVQGRGYARVCATGPRSEIGKIGKSLHKMQTTDSPLQKEINRLVRWLAVIGFSICLLLVIIYGLGRSDWLHGLLTGITLAMSILPEEYPLVLTVFFAMGAWRLSKHQILTRRIPTVESLGSTTVLCVDKTGTLTLNHMTVQKLMVEAEIYTPVNAEKKGVITGQELPEIFHELLEFAVLASEIQAFDPMEKAIHELATAYLSHTEHLHQDWLHKHDYALSTQLLALSHVWKARDRDEYVVASKGAPEAIADLCHLNAAQVAQLNLQINELAAGGLRILGVAKASYKGPEWPAIQHDFEFEFIGLIGLADPVRPTVSAALKECSTAGIRVVMITGDYPATAHAIAQQIGLAPGSAGIISGPELSEMDDATLSQRVRHSNIFARMLPQQKLRLVNALKQNGEVVAMTGDGVNDAPALKSAHIGIAMGGRGTDVAREAAGLVLLDDDFASIVHAIRLGRGIFDNMRKAMAYIFAVHIPIIGLSLLPLLLGWPAIFAPVHIVFLEMIINPACSIAFEAEPAESHIMQRPPRSHEEALFGMHTLLFSLLQGLGLLLATLLTLGYAMQTDASSEAARTLTFCTLVVGNLSLILVNRSWQKTFLNSSMSNNKPLWWVIGGALGFLGLTLTLPMLREVFHFTPITLVQFSLSATAGLLSVIWFEWFKSRQRQR
jgi:P-type Ca2+ transporter type 2C